MQRVAVHSVDNEKTKSFEQRVDIQPMILITMSWYGTSCNIAKRPTAAPAETKHIAVKRDSTPATLTHARITHTRHKIHMHDASELLAKHHTVES